MKPGQNFTLGSLLFVSVFILSAIGLYAGASLVDRAEPAAAGDADGEVPTGPLMTTLIAQSLKFDKRTIVAGTGVQVTVTLDNRDPGTLHNVAFYTNRSAAQTIAKGELFPGPAVRTDPPFTAPSTPGNYFFRCDAHPDTMSGAFIVR
jgi:hypothetical protein